MSLNFSVITKVESKYMSYSRTQLAQGIADKVKSSKAVELIEGPFGYLINKAKVKITQNNISLKYIPEGCDNEIEYNIDNKKLNKADIYEDEITFNDEPSILIRMIPA